MGQVWDEIWDYIALFLFVSWAVFIVLILLALFLSVGWLIRTVTGTGEREDAPPLPTRMFGAPHGSRWVMAYDYWLFQLERATGIEFNIDPTRLLIGCIVITAGPAVLAGSIVDLLDPAPGMGWMGGLGAAGLLIGIIAGRMQASPAIGWFDAVSSSGSSHGPRRGFLDLGEDE